MRELEIGRRFIREAFIPYAKGLGLSKFPDHADIFVFSFIFFTLAHQVLAPAVSRWFFPTVFGKTEKRERINWSIHVVSQLHTLIIIPFAYRCLGLVSLDQDRAFGWDKRAGTVQAIACGYFLWDSLDAIVNFTDIGFVIHGLACLAIYMLSFKPFLAYYAVRCLFWESSTFFLNIHWFSDKTGRTGSTFQLINGIILLLTFFSVRIVWGGYISYNFFHTLYDVRRDIPWLYVPIYGLGNIVLQALNWLWFGKMINSLRKRFNGASDNTNSLSKRMVGKFLSEGRA